MQTLSRLRRGNRAARIRLGLRPKFMPFAAVQDYMQMAHAGPRGQSPTVHVVIGKPRVVHDRLGRRTEIRRVLDKRTFDSWRNPKFQKRMRARGH